MAAVVSNKKTKENHHQFEEQKKKDLQKEQETLKEICNNNGFTYSKIQQEGHTIKKIEQFFTGFTEILGLRHFPNLQTLCIIGQGLSRIDGLNVCHQLRELWISECAIKTIEGLDQCLLLRKLYLYGNAIEVVENLEHLLELQVLWLNDNNITCLQGLSRLKYLRELNLADNSITDIGNSLNYLYCLERLELSGNLISSFKDIYYLTQLPSLYDLGLCSPLYSPNPIGLLCNYSIHVLYHLPHLTRLDTQDVTAKSLHELVNVTVEKKKMFYKMKIQFLDAKYTQERKQLKQDHADLVQEHHDKLQELLYAAKEIESVNADQNAPESKSNKINGSDKETANVVLKGDSCENSTLVDKLDDKKMKIQSECKNIDRKVKMIGEQYKEVIRQMSDKFQQHTKYIQLELESGGNIRLEEGSPNHPWYVSCHDLVLSRFCASDFKEFGITGIKVTGITRIHNRLLCLEFEELIASLVEEEEEEKTGQTGAQTSYSCTSAPPYRLIPRKLLEYLFLVNYPDMPPSLRQAEAIMQHGFIDPSIYKKYDKDEAIPLTNSLYHAEKARLIHEMKQMKMNASGEKSALRSGHVFLGKVYIGKSCQTNTKKSIEQKNFLEYDTVYRPRKSHGNSAGNQTCECAGSQCEWFAFTSTLVVPEYLVHLEYTTKIQPSNPFIDKSQYLSAKGNLPSNVGNKYLSNDYLQDKPMCEKHNLFNQELLLEMTNADSLGDITRLDLRGRGLSKIKPLNDLKNLKILLLSLNKIEKLEEFSLPSIEQLDLSFNRLKTLEGLKACPKLLHLDASWNKLTNTSEDISILQKQCPVLTKLDVQNNPWHKEENLRLLAIGRLKTLTELNAAPVTEQEATTALRQAAGSRISHVSLVAHSCLEEELIPNLSLESNAKHLCQKSRNRPDHAAEINGLWYKQITALNLDGQHISKLSHLERLESLRWASFNDNDINEIKGLENCVLLEELSLNNNSIRSIEGLQQLHNLTHLSLNHNFISHVDVTILRHLTNLRSIALADNLLTTLQPFLSASNCLEELYISNNNLTNIREVFNLKNLPNLSILDLSGNPLVKTMDNYRLFVIYHLRNLKSLDAIPIEISEFSMAKEAFGGRLTVDFVAERLGRSTFNEVKELDFPGCNIRLVDLGNAHAFANIRSLNLENNSLTSFGGITNLPSLRVLCLNNNKIESISPKPKQVNHHATRTSRPSQVLQPELLPADHLAPVLENLEVLHLGYNGIKDMALLQLSRLRSLKALFLQGNEIQRIEGLDGCPDLRELVLDRNKIKAVDAFSFVNQWNLQELHLEENRIKDLSYLGGLENLQRLFLGNNRIQDINELEKLETLHDLVEISVIGNAIARRLLHRPVLVFRMPSLLQIDGIQIIDEERAKAELYFMEQQPPVQTNTLVEATLPGIGQYKAQIPVKVTNMQLLSGPFGQFSDRTYGGTLQISDEALQQERNRRKPANRSGDNQPGLARHGPGSGDSGIYRPGQQPNSYNPQPIDYAEVIAKLNRANKR